MSDRPDFRLEGFEPADADADYVEQRFWSGDLTVLAEHHTGLNGSHSFVVAHDGSVTWGVPGEPQLAAIKVTRDLSLNTFTFEAEYHATVSFAQRWLIERGCPPEEIAQVGEDFMRPADDLTIRVEQQIRTSGDRYEVLDSETTDYDPCETWTLTRDSVAAEAPIRVFLEEGNFDAHAYTLREGAFADEVAARRWLDERDSPLPLPPESRDEAAVLRTRAALTRSTGTAALSKAGLDAHHMPSAGTTQRPNHGRSM
ncbi:glycosyl hydrolase [Streptomyces sp. NBC_00257]|uniref:glycosyl hydrolase n=1 Tax=unclassified Streptomyces TaxID=2593676 RepID=UPI002254E0F1|nr:MULTISPECIES: glycosyl hydrolase [unclassified Streptomyces]MCX4870855.1 glycosyl hydrolase [Streptomyces sp. NBC_00906]MCX4901595.1 glycosyl hydrolase [Streptomyces sp. NBC_00892]MCX5426838.1 glycosyl hydrolase [Streptomyces sp. NBC_00062]